MMQNSRVGIEAYAPFHAYTKYDKLGASVIS
jgi:hypothetical protein